MAARAVVHLPATPPKAGEVIEVRAVVSHPMETGFRADAEGRVQPRDIVRRLEARLDGRLVFAAELHPSIAANPYVAFSLKVERSGTLELRWRGDNGFEHAESRPLAVAG